MAHGKKDHFTGVKVERRREAATKARDEGGRERPTTIIINPTVLHHATTWSVTSHLLIAATLVKSCVLALLPPGDGKKCAPTPTTSRRGRCVVK